MSGTRKKEFDNSDAPYLFFRLESVSYQVYLAQYFVKLPSIDRMPEARFPQVDMEFLREAPHFLVYWESNLEERWFRQLWFFLDHSARCSFRSGDRDKTCVIVKAFEIAKSFLFKDVMKLRINSVLITELLFVKNIYIPLWVYLIAPLKETLCKLKVY